MSWNRFGLLFFVSSISFMPLHASAQAKDSLLAQLERKWSHAKSYALKIAEMMPEEFYDFKPVPEEMSFREQLVHIARNINWLSTAYLFAKDSIPFNETVVKGKDSLIKALTRVFDLGLLAHQRFPAQRLDEAVPFFAGPMTRRQIFFLIHDHESHHIGQLIVYLRLKGIQPPNYVGW